MLNVKALSMQVFPADRQIRQFRQEAPPRHCQMRGIIGADVVNPFVILDGKAVQADGENSKLSCAARRLIQTGRVRVKSGGAICLNVEGWARMSVAGRYS